MLNPQKVTSPTRELVIPCPPVLVESPLYLTAPPFVPVVYRLPGTTVPTLLDIVVVSALELEVFVKLLFVW